MPKVIWTPEYSVNVKLLDDQHKEMIGFMNEIYDRAESLILPTEVNNFFVHIKAYSVDHFTTEEKYFDLFKYDGAEEHKKAHSAFLAGMDELQEKYRLNGTNVILYELVQTLEDHLFSHIMQLDKKYTKCFNEHGLY